MRTILGDDTTTNFGERIIVSIMFPYAANVACCYCSNHEPDPKGDGVNDGTLIQINTGGGLI